MKLCKDCRYFVDNGIQFPKCGHPNNRSPVNGEPDYNCNIQRACDEGMCGLDARWFEPKEKELRNE